MMNSIDFRTEKENAIFRYRNLQRVTTVFRFMEIFVFIVVISSFSSQLPFSVRVFADSFRGISFTSFSPKFVFVIGNVIVLILLFKYRVAENGDRNGQFDVYDECVKRCEKTVVNTAADRTICRSRSEKMMKTECKTVQKHRKLTRSLTERNVFVNVDRCEGKTLAPMICRSESEKMMTVQRKEAQSLRQLTPSVNVVCCEIETPEPEIRRSSSEKMMTVECNDSQSCRKLRRSVTEKKMLKNDNCCGGETPAPESCGVDALSSEAFRLTVEAFIAKQQRSLRDEELAPVPYVGASSVNN